MELQFKETYSIPQFKQEKEISTIDIVRNPKTRDLFFTTDGVISGPLSRKVDIEKDELVVSLCQGSEGEFYMVHKKPSNNILMSL